MISPQFVYVIHKDKEKELQYKIDLARTARERRASEASVSLEQRPAWFAQALDWMKGKLVNRASANQRADSQPQKFEEPCPGVPC